MVTMSRVSRPCNVKVHLFKCVCSKESAEGVWMSWVTIEVRLLCPILAPETVTLEPSRLHSEESNVNLYDGSLG